MNRQIKIYAFLLFVFGVTTSCLRADIQVMDSGYEAELFASYQVDSYNSKMSSDSAGNLYVVNRDAGSISKIDSSGNVTVNWSSGYGYSFDIVETTGTTYGSGFVVSAKDDEKVYQVDINGNKTELTSLDVPLALAIDTQGSYGSSLFGVAAQHDQIYKISTSGQPTLFSNEFYNISGLIMGLTFDLDNRYGGGMFAAVQSPYSVGGIYRIDATGNATRFTSDIVSTVIIEFDELNGFFGGDMFSRGLTSSTGDVDIFRVGTDGTATSFIKNTGPFCFGTDGAMYTAVKNDETGFVNVYRVAPVPEPATLLLLGLGGLLIRRRT